MEIRIDEAGVLDIAVDRIPQLTEGAQERSDLPRLLAEIATGLGSPVRVEIHESNGAIFTDIITPPEPLSEPGESMPGNLEGFTSGLSAVGFEPGEDVAVAIIISHHTANADGIARLRLPTALAADVKVLLAGATSGNVAICESAA